MIMRLWAGNDVNPSCLLHSPPRAYQILNIIITTIRGNTLFTQINIIINIAFISDWKCKYKKIEVSKWDSPTLWCTLDWILHEGSTWLVIVLVECVSSCKGFSPLRAVYQKAVKRDAKSTDECLRDRCVKWPWYITFSFKAAAKKIVPYLAM